MGDKSPKSKQRAQNQKSAAKSTAQSAAAAKQATAAPVKDPKRK